MVVIGFVFILNFGDDVSCCGVGGVMGGRNCKMGMVKIYIMVDMLIFILRLINVGYDYFIFIFFLCILVLRIL